MIIAGKIDTQYKLSVALDYMLNKTYRIFAGVVILTMKLFCISYHVFIMQKKYTFTTECLDPKNIATWWQGIQPQMLIYMLK